MLEAWEERAYRKQPEYDPQNYCSRCGEKFHRNQLEEHGDELLCRNCLEIVLEEEKNGD
jgi:formylmethanofuran dehydrogenase subunit E